MSRLFSMPSPRGCAQGGEHEASRRGDAEGMALLLPGLSAITYWHQPEGRWAAWLGFGRLLPAQDSSEAPPSLLG